MSSPIVLVDGGDDGLYDEGWVEGVVPETEVLAYLAPLNTDPELYALRVDGTTYLRADDPTNVESCWKACLVGDEGAVEFWSVRAVDR